MNAKPAKRRISVAARLYCATLLSVLAVAALAGAAVHFASVTDEAARRLSTDAVRGIESSARLQVLLEKHRRIVESAPAELDRSRLADARRLLREVDGNIAVLAAEHTGSETGNRPALARLAGSIASEMPELTDLGRKVIALAENYAQDKALALAQGGYDRVADRLQNQISTYRQERLEIADRSIARLLSGSHDLLYWVSFSTAVALILTAALAALVTRGVLSRLVGIKQSMILLAQDDTSAVVPCRDDLDEVGDMARAVEVFKANAIELLYRKAEIEAVNERFDAALKNMPHGLCMYDAEDRLVVFNRRFLEIYHLPKLSVVPGIPFRDVLELSESAGNLPGRDVSEVYAARKAFIAKRRRGEFLHELPDGRTVQVRHVPLAAGGWLATYEDISRRQRAEAELRAAKQKAELADRAKSEFLATMSHEIRTPLNGIIACADLLLERADAQDRQRHHLNSIQTAAAMLLTVVNDVLDFSKIEAGQIAFDMQPFSPVALLESTASVVRSSAEQKRLAVQVETRGEVPDCVLGDQDRLRQVLLNLLNNAVKFTNAGHVACVLDGSAAGTGEWTARFSVTDTGIGIPAAKRARLFERFSQVDSSIAREFGGTGLGLAISKQLVELMGGTIGVESVEGQGSTFWFAITLKEAESRPRHEPAAVQQRAARAASLLLVDDNDINREVAQTVLQAAGYRVDVVADGADAVSAVQTGSYDLILMDVHMPGVDGVTATRLIRGLDHPARDIPIVAMTANVLPRQVEGFKAGGMNDHVGKPFKKDRLVAVIEACLAAAQNPAPAGGSAAQVLDQKTYADLQDLMGHEHMGRLLDRLVLQVESCLQEADLTPEGRQKLARKVHALVSASGMLGFVTLSRAARALESACRGDGDLASALESFQAVRRQALHHIVKLKEAA